MINKMKNRIVLLLSSIVCLLCVLAFGLTGVKVKADEASSAENTKVFAMYRTASVRYGNNAAEKTGIRFAARLSKESFKEYVGDATELTVTFEVDKAGNTDEGEAQSKTYTITENDFASKNEITLYYSILFNLNADEILAASKMQLEAKCYAQTAAGTPIYAENCSATQGVVQDMRSVASFNALQPSVAGDLSAYFGAKAKVDGTASYMSGTLGVKIDLGEEIGNDKTVYINTHRVDNAVIDGTTLTIAKADMPEMLGEPLNPVNYVQIFDANNNVTVKELTAAAVSKSVDNFSAMDGDFNVAEIVGENVAVNAVDTVANSAVAEGEEFATLTLNDNKLSGLQTASNDWTNAVVRLTTDYTVYDVTVKAATKIIDEAEDLKVFTVKAAEVAEGEAAHATEVSGFYALTKNIDASDLTLDAHSGYKAKWYPTYSVDKGFSGTLDGQGYTISNLTVKGEGLFSVLYEATIKNIGFVGGKAEAGSGYTAFLAHFMYKATLSNVYVNVISLNGTKSEQTVLAGNAMHLVNMTNVVVDYAQSEFTEGKYYSAFGFINAKNTNNQGKWNNVYAISAAPLASASGHMMVASNQSETEVAALQEKFLPGQTVTTLTVDGVKSYANAAQMAAAKNDVTAFESKYWTVKGGVPYWNGVSEDKYLSAEDFTVQATTDGEGYGFKDEISFAIADVNGKTLSTEVSVSLVNAEDSECVDILNNKVSKKAAYTVSEDKEISVKLTATFGNLTVEKTVTLTLLQNFDNYAQKTIENLYIEADGTIVGLSEENQAALENVTYKTALKGTAIAFAEGKLATDFLAEMTLGNSSSIVAISEDTVYTLNYRYVTRAIDEAEDLKVFQAVSKGTDATSGKSTGTYAIEGYYVLTKNIDANGLTLAHGAFYNSVVYPNASYDGGFRGTFDGQGYTISNLTTPSTGLFSQTFKGAVIKNVGFVNASMSGTYMTLFGQRVHETTIENVYIQMDAIPNKGYILAQQEMKNCTLRNVIIDVPMETTNLKSGGAYGIANFSGNQFLPTKGSWTNVYVLSKMPFEAAKKGIKVDGTEVQYDYLIVAGNTTDEQIAAYRALGVYSELTNYDTVVLEDVKSYENASAMAKANEDLSGFDTAYWDVSTGVPVWKTK